MVSETSPRCRPDILERAKAADIDSLAGTDWSALREIVQGLIAEVERLRSQSVEQVFRRKNEEIAAKDARIKELETHGAALEERLRQELTHTAAQREIIDQQEARTEELKAQVDQSRTEIVGRIQECQCCMAHGESAYMQRLEAAFLDVKIDLLVEACRWREDVAEKEAREALERIKADEKL